MLTRWLFNLLLFSAQAIPMGQDVDAQVRMIRKPAINDDSGHGGCSGFDNGFSEIPQRIPKMLLKQIPKSRTLRLAVPPLDLVTACEKIQASGRERPPFRAVS